MVDGVDDHSRLRPRRRPLCNRHHKSRWNALTCRYEERLPATATAGLGRLVVRITSAPADSPLYEVQAKARPTRGSAVEVVIKTEEEPLYPQFFTRVGQLCGRPVVPLGATETYERQL